MYAPRSTGQFTRLCWLGCAVLLAACGLLFGVPAFAADYGETVGLFRSGKYAECVESAAKAIGEEEYSENFRLLKIRAELELGRYADAKTTLDEALKRFTYSLELRWLGRDVCRFNNEPQRAKELEEEMVKLATQSAWRYTDALNQVVIGKFFLSQGMDPKKILDGQYQEAKKQRPTLAEPFLASGELALEKNDFALAAEAFAQAIKNDAGNPDAHFGLARAFAPSEDDKTEAAIKAALALNPNHVPSLLLVAENHIDSERYEEAATVLAQVEAVNPHHPRAAAFRAVLAHLANETESEKRYHQAALRHWPTNPEVDYLIGRKLSQKYRFAEGAQYQRQALTLDPKYFPAKMQLAQDLLRLGQEEEGWKLAEEAYGDDGYNVVAYNLVTLQESLAKFRTLEEEGFVVRMDAREAEIYGRRVFDLLKRARTTLCAKYDVKLEQPIVVEMFPRQQDFAIRTFGLPGGAGFLGVCFGTVITANSPASQGASPTCWESTLWHEFCHVVTLNKTRNKMPRWLSEGISVYEERQADPAWGQTINPQYRQMLLGDELTPVSELSGAFLSPKSPLHLQFAYYESSLVVEYLVETHGIEAMQRILVDLGVGMPINDALARYVGSVEALNEEFAKFARKKANDMAPEADWSEPELPRRANSEAIAAWLKDHPQNYAGLGRLARQLIAEKKWEAAKEPLEKMLKLYPHDATSDGPHAMQAQVHRELGENQAEQAVLEKLVGLSDNNVGALERLTELTAEKKDWELTRKYAQRWLAVNPLQTAPHRRAAEAAEGLGADALAIESFGALLLLEPVDPADLHLRMASALKRSGDLPAARRHALLALEETPRFRAAHRLLLEIVRELEVRTETIPAEKTRPDSPSPEKNP